MPTTNQKFAALHKIAQIAHALNVPLWLSGSFAVEIFTHTSINPNGDIDFVCDKAKDYQILKNALLKTEGYSMIKEVSWESIRRKNSQSHNLKLQASHDVIVDIGFIKGDIDLRYHKKQIPFPGLPTVYIFSPKDLLKIYKTFGHENPAQNDIKIELLQKYLIES